MNEIDNDEKFSKWFWSRYRTQIVIFTIGILILLVLIYLIFAFTTPVPAGRNLTRSDWLAFTGGVLALIGSIVVSAISITQASYFNEKEQKRQDEQRKYDEVKKAEDRIEEIRPELVIVINGRNVRIPYIDRWPSERLHRAMFGTDLPDKYKEKKTGSSNVGTILDNLNTMSMMHDYPVDNVWVSIVNIGKYPVRHLEVYGEYYFPFIKPGECIDIVLTLDSYPRRTKAYSSSYGLDRINDSMSTVKVIDARKEGIDEDGAHIEEPKQYDRVWMDFEDIDGNSYQQTFRTHPSGVGNYYCNDELRRTNG